MITSLGFLGFGWSHDETAAYVDPSVSNQLCDHHCEQK